MRSADCRNALWACVLVGVSCSAPRQGGSDGVESHQHLPAAEALEATKSTILVEIEGGRPVDPSPLVVVSLGAEEGIVVEEVRAPLGVLEWVRGTFSHSFLVLSVDPIAWAPIPAAGVCGDKVRVNLRDLSAASMFEEWSNNQVASLIRTASCRLSLGPLREAALAEAVQRADPGLVSSIECDINCVDMSSLCATTRLKDVESPVLLQSRLLSVSTVPEFVLEFENKSLTSYVTVQSYQNWKSSGPRVVIRDDSQSVVWDNAVSVSDGDCFGLLHSVGRKLAPGAKLQLWSSAVPELPTGHYSAEWWFNDRYPTRTRNLYENIVVFNGHCDFEVH